MSEAKTVYELKKGDIPSYMLGLLKSGRCGALLPGTFYEEGESVTVICDASGAKSFSEILRENEPGLLAGFSKLLSSLEKLCESVITAENWFIGEKHVSFLPEDLFFDSESGKAKLLLKPNGPGFQESVKNIIQFAERSYPLTNAKLCEERINEETAKGRLSPRRLLRILTVWEFELSDEEPKGF